MHKQASSTQRKCPNVQPMTQTAGLHAREQEHNPPQLCHEQVKQTRTTKIQQHTRQDGTHHDRRPPANTRQPVSVCISITAVQNWTTRNNLPTVNLGASPVPGLLSPQLVSCRPVYGSNGCPHVYTAWCSPGHSCELLHSSTRDILGLRLRFNFQVPCNSGHATLVHNRSLMQW